MARALIDAGASLVLGHHPHVLPEVERYRGGLIAYSLGNFLFANDKLTQRQTMSLRVTLLPRRPGASVGAVELVPVLIDARAQVPLLATGAGYHAL